MNVDGCRWRFPERSLKEFNRLLRQRTGRNHSKPELRAAVLESTQRAVVKAECASGVSFYVDPILSAKFGVNVARGLVVVVYDDTVKEWQKGAYR